MVKKYHTAKRFRVWLSAMLAAAFTLLFSACALSGGQEVRLRDLDFTILSENVIPGELKKVIDDRKAESFQLTYTDKENLYIVIGYGEQKTGGYSIAVKELYLTESAVCVDTELLGPEVSGDGAQKNEPSYPYIVIKTEYLDQTVMFE